MCHDIGHLPFSHAAEEELLPTGIRHEHLSLNLILSSELEPLWRELNINPAHVGKLAVGPKYYPEPLAARGRNPSTEERLANRSSVDFRK